MLVIKRTPGEELIIAEDIRVRVLGVHRRTVALGIKAPRDIEVDRLEIRERKQGRRNGRPQPPSR